MKKILSIILALTLVLGMSAIAASAANLTTDLSSYNVVGVDGGNGPYYTIKFYRGDELLVDYDPLPANVGNNLWNPDVVLPIGSAPKYLYVGDTITVDIKTTSKWTSTKDAPEDLEVIWYVIDECGANATSWNLNWATYPTSSNLELTKAGTIYEGNAYTIQDNDIGKVIYVGVVSENSKRDGIIDKTQDQIHGFAAFFNMQPTQAIKVRDTLLPLVQAKVLNEEFISGLAGVKRWMWETIAPFGDLQDEVTAVNSAYSNWLRAAKDIFGSNVDIYYGKNFGEPATGPTNPNNSGYRAWLQAGPLDAMVVITGTPTLAQARQYQTYVTALNNAVKKVWDEADKVANDILDNAAKLVDEFFALLNGFDQTKLTPENQVRLINAIAKVKNAQLNIGQLRKLIDSNTTAREKINYAIAAANYVEEIRSGGALNLPYELLEELIKGDKLTDAEKAAFEAKIKELQDKIAELEGKEPTVIIVNEGYDGIYEWAAKLIGSRGIPAAILTFVVRYIGFGWLWSDLLKLALVSK